MTLGLGAQFALIAAASALAMTTAWLVQRRTRDAGIVDVTWAACLGAAAVLAAATGGGDPGRRVLVGILGGVWGARLAWHLLTDRVLKGPEDGRYQMLRGRFGPRVQPVLFAFFQAQAALVVVLSPPFLLGAADPRPFPGVLDAAAAGLWLVGLAGEWTADRQLARFKADPTSRGRVCDTGLWRLSRHPNYFFEWLMWCAYALLAVAAPWGWLALLSPALILLLVLKVTGVPPTEARALRSRPEAYRQYQQTTSVFVPWPPRRSSPSAIAPAASREPRS